MSMSYYRTYKFKSYVEPTEEQKLLLIQYNKIMNNPPNVMFASNEELDEFYSEKIVLELDLSDLIEE